jgi:hypothetical protein
MSYAAKLEKLARLNRALVVGNDIVNVNGYFVPAVVHAVCSGDTSTLPQFPHPDEVDAGKHPEVAAWIDAAPLAAPHGLLDVDSPEYMLFCHGIINDQRVSVNYTYDADGGGVRRLAVDAAPPGTIADSISARESGKVHTLCVFPSRAGEGETESDTSTLPVALLNAPVLTADGTFEISTISVEEARALCAHPVISYVGHSGTARIMETVLRIPVTASRAELKQAPFQVALVFSLNARQAEGVVLDEAAIESVGYTFKRLVRVK